MEQTRTVAGWLDRISEWAKLAVLLFKDPLVAGAAGPGGGRARLLKPLRVTLQVVQQIGEDRCYQQASSLAYKTILSVVPTAAVALSLLKAFGAFSGTESPVVRFVAGLVMPPNEAEVLASKIIGFTSQISFGAIGGVGMISLIVVAVSLLETVDETFNQIWRTQRKRSRFIRFTIFYTMLTLGPLLLTVSLIQSGRVQGFIPGGVVAELLAYLTPLAVSWVSLVCAYKLFPTCTVRWRWAAVGALLAAIGIEAVKLAFNYFLSESLSTSYTKLYGALALIPLFLVWIYVLWLIVLVGVEYSYILQHFDSLRRARQDVLDAAARRSSFWRLQAGEGLACRLLAVVGEAFERGLPAPDEQELASACAADREAVSVMVQLLLEQGFLRSQTACGEEETEGRQGLLPGRSLERIRLRDVVEAVRRPRLHAGRRDAGGPLEDWLEGLEAELRTRLDETSLAQVVPLPESNVTKSTADSD